MITENLDTFLADFGVTVTAGLVSGLGVLDMPDSIVGGFAISTGYSLLGKYADFGALAYGDAITVDGVAYTVQEPPKKVDDGKFCRVELTKV